MWRRYGLACIVCFGILPITVYQLCLKVWTNQKKSEVSHELLSVSSSQLIRETLQSILKEFELTLKSMHIDTIPNSQIPIMKIDLFFTANYDGDVYEFLHRICEQFPGNVITKTLKLKRAQISTHTPVPNQVNGYLLLYWAQPQLLR